MEPVISLLLLPLLLSTGLPAEEFVGSFDLVASQKHANGNERTETISQHFGKEKTAMIIAARGNQTEFRLIFDPAGVQHGRPQPRPARRSRSA